MTYFTILGDMNVSEKYITSVFSVRVRVISKFQEGTRDTAFPSETLPSTYNITLCNYSALITLAARSKASTVFARLNAGIVGSNGCLCVCVYSVFVLFCV
jgi:hypothetical protein